MLGPWPIALRPAFRLTYAHVWKQPDWIYWRCFGLWTAWICRRAEIPQRLIRQLFELDADYAEALWALDQPPATLDMPTMLRHTLIALEQLPEARARFRKKLPSRIHPDFTQLECTVRNELDPNQAYNMVPGRDPQDG